MISPSLNEARAFAEDYTVVPVSTRVYADLRTPIEVLRSICADPGPAFILESVDSADSWGRYTFLGYRPRLTVSVRDGRVIIRDHETTICEDRDPFAVLREILGEYRSPRIDGLPPFTGGLVGYFSYDAVKYAIPGLSLDACDPQNLNDAEFMLVDRVIAFDHYRQQIFLIVNASLADGERGYARAVETLAEMEHLITDPAPPGGGDEAECGEFSPSVTKESFLEAIGRVKHHIREGDVFQTVVSMRFTAAFTGSLLNPYRRLRIDNPSPYMVYLRMDDLEIACSSPETMVRLREGRLESNPLAGSRPRGETSGEDERLAQELLTDPKELAEHDMLVDLARNDLGRLSEFGSVQVEEHRALTRFSRVMHISSHVTGRLRPGLDALDAIAATLPAGTLSGAPKKRACELIDDVEDLKRGPFGGAIGYIDFTGDMDTCIGIRMAVLKDGQVSVQAGAGIVADSDPESEYREVLAKASAAQGAVQTRGGGQS